MFARVWVDGATLLPSQREREKMTARRHERGEQGSQGEHRQIMYARGVCLYRQQDYDYHNMT